MEKTSKAEVVPLDAGWSDVGVWSSIWDISKKDENNNVLKGEVLVEDVHNTYVHSENRLVSVIGLDNVVVIETDDAVMVAAKDKAQQVKSITDQLISQGRSEAFNHRKVYRPWGFYDSIDAGQRFQVKRIVVNPGDI